MKTPGIVGFAAALIVSQLAMAKMPYANDVLGKLEGTLDFCARTDAQSAAKYEQKKKDMVKDASDAELSEARASEEYKKSYEWISDELPKVPKDDALKACKGALEAKN